MSTYKLSRHVQAGTGFILVGLFYLYQMILQVSPNALNLYLAHDFLVTEHRLGLLSSAFYFSYMVMQVPAGILLDKFGVHRMLLWACLICSISTIIFSLTPYFFLASVSRLGMGIGASFAFLSGLKFIINWFPQRFLTFFTGLFASFGMIGGLIGESILSSFIMDFGWRKTMLYIGLLGLILMGLLWKFIGDTPQLKYVNIERTPNQLEKNFKKIYCNQQLWLISFYIGILSVGPLILVSLYGIPFLTIKYNLPIDNAGHIIAFIFIGIIAGDLFWGWIADYTKRRLPPIIISAIFTPLFLYLFVHFSFSMSCLSVMLFLLGVSYSASLPVYSIARETSSPECIGATLGVVNTFYSLGITLILPLFGRLLDFFGHGNDIGHKYVYTLVDYTKAFTFVIFFVSMTLILLPFIKETYSKKTMH